MEAISSSIMAMLGVVFPREDDNTPEISSARQFQPIKDLRDQDLVIIDMLNSKGHEDVAYCICDPHIKDCPIIFSSDGFCTLTGYSHEDIEGRNCRFLQGEETKEEDIDRIRKAIKDEVETSVNLLNYRKDGSPFINEFFVSPLRNSEKELVYFIGVQCKGKKNHVVFQHGEIVKSIILPVVLLILFLYMKSIRVDQDKCLRMLGGYTAKEIIARRLHAEECYPLLYLAK